MLLELAKQAGLDPKKASSTNGGEYHSPCPACRGKDRFYIQPNAHERKGRYRCRRCGISGDTVEFCRNILGMTFQEALAATGASSTLCLLHPQKISEKIRKPSGFWNRKAQAFIEASHQRLLIDPKAIKIVTARGLSLESIRLNQIGWNPETAFQRRSEWGLDEAEDRLWICLPKGIVIPSVDRFGSSLTVSKIKIRRADWIENDKYPKYHEVPGSSNIATIYGFRTNLTAMIVESELDALVVSQEVGEFGTCVALGGAQKRPDVATLEWMKEKKLILYSLDCDEAGREQYDYWRSTFPNLRAWPAESNKSPGESFVKNGVDLKKWFLEGISHWKEKLYVFTGGGGYE